MCFVTNFRLENNKMRNKFNEATKKNLTQYFQDKEHFYLKDLVFLFHIFIVQFLLVSDVDHIFLSNRNFLVKHTLMEDIKLKPVPNILLFLLVDEQVHNHTEINLIDYLNDLLVKVHVQ